MEKNNCVNCKINYCEYLGSNRKWEDGFECSDYVSACTSSKQPARKPQCKTRAELHREWARVLEICEAARFAFPWECVKYDQCVCISEHVSAMRFDELPPELYEFAIAIIEGHPVFAGTDFYKDGKKFTMGNHHSGLGFEGCTLSPPKPETISINGVELKAPHFVGYSFVFVKEKFTVNVEYKNQADAVAFKAALEGKKP